MSIHAQPLDDTDCFEDPDTEAFVDQVVTAALAEDEEDIFADPTADVMALFTDGSFTEAIRTQLDQTYACTCAHQPDDAKHHLFVGHETKCNVRKFNLWEHALCEWSRLWKRFLYYPKQADEVVIEEARKEEVPALKKAPQNTSLFGKGAWDDDAYSGYTAAKWEPKCRHNHEAVTFPDETVIHASSSGQHKDHPKVDFGCYAYDGFRPEPDIALFLSWQDFGLPHGELRLVVYELKRMVMLAREGFDIEVGCMGGHGRTGTMLACMATLCGVPPAEAVAWVRTHYCAEAIETEEQEWFVLAFDAHVNDTEAPPKPKPKAKTNKTLPKRDGWCPECKRPIDTKGCDGYACAHKDCRLYDIKAHPGSPILTSDPKGGAAHANDGGRAQGSP
jgi:protein-tyrosine phosphatase